MVSHWYPFIGPRPNLLDVNNNYPPMRLGSIEADSGLFKQSPNCAHQAPTPTVISNPTTEHLLSGGLGKDGNGSGRPGIGVARKGDAG